MCCLYFLIFQSLLFPLLLTSIPITSLELLWLSTVFDTISLKSFSFLLPCLPPSLEFLGPW